MGAPSLTYSLSNGNTADASQVMQNFNDLLNGYTDGTKDLTISALTVNGAASFKGAVTLGDATGDDITHTGSLASSIPIKTNNTYDVGSSTLGLRKLYLGNGGAGATCDIVSASHATTREYTVPDCGAAANFVMTQSAQTLTGVLTLKGSTTGSAIGAGYVGEVISNTGSTAITVAAVIIVSITVTAGTWLITGAASSTDTGSATAFRIGFTTAASTTFGSTADLQIRGCAIALNSTAGANLGPTALATSAGTTTYNLVGATVTGAFVNTSSYIQAVRIA